MTAITERTCECDYPDGEVCDNAAPSGLCAFCRSYCVAERERTEGQQNGSEATP